MNSQGSTAIQAFVFPETNQKVRVFVDEDGTLWFVAADVCRLLGYVNSRDAIRRHCKIDGVTKRNTVSITSENKRRLRSSTKPTCIV